MHTRHNDILYHPTIEGFTAPGYLWAAARATIYGNTDTVGLSQVAHPRTFALAWARHKPDGTAALVWAIEETNRALEAQNERDAIRHLARGLSAVAESLTTDIELLLAKLPPQLRDRVQDLAGV